MAGRKKSTTESSVKKASKAEKEISVAKETVAEVKKPKPSIIGNEQHKLEKNKELVLCVPHDTARVRLKNMGGGDVLVKAPIETKIFSGEHIDIDTNENIVLYAHSFPVVSITYWR